MEERKKISLEILNDFNQLQNIISVVDGRPCLLDFSFINPEPFLDLIPEVRVMQIGTGDGSAKDVFKSSVTYKGTINMDSDLWLAFEIDPSEVKYQSAEGIFDRPRVCLLYLVIEPVLGKKALIVPKPFEGSYTFYKAFFIKGIIN